MMKVEFNKPVFLPEHAEAIRRCMENQHLVGDGPISKRCEAWLEKTLSTSVRLVTSATHALEMMALLLDLKPGDEVILPSFTFVSCANAFALRGATLRFADNDEFGNLKLSEVERLHSPRTRAVLAVHYAGHSADMDWLLNFCRTRKIALLEDAAQAIGAKYKDRFLGTIGDLGCFSFHATKNITSGEGGALLINNRKYLQYAEVMREKGTNRKEFVLGLADKYTWVALGSSYVLSDLNAAYLEPQLGAMDQINAKRGKIVDQYLKELSSALEKNGSSFLPKPEYNISNSHLCGILFPRIELRNRFIHEMKEKGVTCPFHYVPLHQSPIGQDYIRAEDGPFLRSTEMFSQSLARLPLYYNMTDSEQEYVVDQCMSFLK